MTNIAVTGSSWIVGLSYVPMAAEQKARARELGENGDGLLVVVTDHGRYGYLTPSWCVGLLAAAQARGLSVGKAVNRMIRRRGYPSVKVS